MKTSENSVAGGSEPTPLTGDLATIFRLIEAGGTGPARVRLVRYQRLYPDDGQAAFLMGLTYHEERRYGKALPHLERAVELRPDYAVTFHFLGWCRFYLGDLDGAAAAFERHLESDPDEGDSHFGLGLIAMDRDDVAEAERRFQRAIELQMDDPARQREAAKAMVRLADVRQRQGRLDEAQALLEESISIFPDHYEAHYRLARILLRKGETERADQAMAAFREVFDRVNPMSGDHGDE